MCGPWVLRPLRGTLFLTVLTAALVGLTGPSAQGEQYVYDDYLTLSLTTSAQSSGVRVRANAFLPRDVVEKWTDGSMSAKLADGSANPEFRRSRGYRVRIAVARDGLPLEALPTQGGMGPLADRVGVFTTRVGDHQVWMRSGRCLAEFEHPAGDAAAEYRITWYINCKAARTETLRLPLEGGGQRSTETAGLSARNGLGTYPAGTAVGAPYPFTQEAPPEGWQGQGAGLLVAAVPASEAQAALGLPEQPGEDVLVGWQPDGAQCHAWFFSSRDAALAIRPSPADVSDLPVGQTVETKAGPSAMRVSDGAAGLRAAIALSPGSLLSRDAPGGVSVAQGVARLSVQDGTLLVTAGGRWVGVDGLAMVEVGAEATRVWCVTRRVLVGTAELQSGQVATLSGGEVSIEQYPLVQLREPFLSTCLAGGNGEHNRQRDSDEVARDSGVITDLILCRGLDAGQRPIEPGTQFPAGTDNISLVVGYRLPGKTTARIGITLLHNDAPRSKSTTEVAGSGKFVVTFRPRGAAAYASGEWALQVEVDGRPDRELEFTIGQ